MSQPDPDMHQRLTSLLADRATQGLTPVQERELDALLRDHADARDLAAQYDRVEAGLALAAHATPEPLPPELRATLLQQGHDAVARARASASSPDAPASAQTPASDPPRSIPFAAPATASRRARAHPLASLGWLAAAAAIALAAIAWWPAQPPAAPTPTLADRRAALEQQAPDAITIALEATDDPAAAGLTGDIVWSNTRQEGYLRLRGLSPNDPAREQFQLWIDDHARDDRHPVPAGVFDVAQADIDPITREIIIPFRASLPIERPRAFALTLERPGGVVVSDRTRLLAAAPVG